MIYRILPLVMVLTFLSGCGSKHLHEKPKEGTIDLKTLYDFKALDSDYKPVHMHRLAKKLAKYDVVFIGEYHGNQASHLFEAKLLASLEQINKKKLILSLEMFERDQQEILDEYLQGKVGEQYLVDKAPAWKGYKGQYRAVVEYAKKHNLEVVAANAFRDIVRCIGANGADYFTRLTPHEQTLIAKNPFQDIAKYKEKYFSLMGDNNHMPKNRLNNSYLAQITRDNTMAESIYKAYTNTPHAQVLHLNGNFHSQDHLGTVAALKNLDASLFVAVIEPIRLDAFDANKTSKKDTFYYLINAQPQEFVSKEYQKEVYMQKFKKSREKAKKCKEE